MSDEIENYWQILRPDPAPPGVATLHVGEALERVTKAIRRYYDTEGNPQEVFTLTIQPSTSKDIPTKYRILVVCTVVKEAKEEWANHNNGPFHNTLEGAVDALYRSVTQRIKEETEGWVESAREVETQLKQYNEVVAEMRRILSDMGEYLPPQGNLPLEASSSATPEENESDDAKDNGPPSFFC